MFEDMVRIIGLDELFIAPDYTGAALFLVGVAGLVHFVCMANFLSKCATLKIQAAVLLCGVACVWITHSAFTGHDRMLAAIAGLAAFVVFEWARWTDGFHVCDHYTGDQS